MFKYYQLCVICCMKEGTRIFSPIAEAIAELNNFSIYLYSPDLLPLSHFPHHFANLHLSNKYVGSDF